MSRTRLLGLGLLGGLAACAGADHPPPGALPGSVDLSGKWLSTWGPMVLVQDGESVRGKVEYKSGELSGRIQGDLFLFEWTQPGNRAEGVLAVSGRGWMRIAPDLDDMEGGWGYRDRYQGGGVWKAERDRSRP